MEREYRVRETRFHRSVAFRRQFENALRPPDRRWTIGRIGMTDASLSIASLDKFHRENLSTCRMHCEAIFSPVEKINGVLSRSKSRCCARTCFHRARADIIPATWPRPAQRNFSAAFFVHLIEAVGGSRAVPNPRQMLIWSKTLNWSSNACAARRQPGRNWFAGTLAGSSISATALRVSGRKRKI